jgi:hypothetical protein
VAKELEELYWIEELLPQYHSRRKMFGGFAYYADEKLILFLIESLGNRTYRGQEFDFEIWNGVMFPAEKEHHPEILQKYPFLRNHPILPKWLYIPVGVEDFESEVESVMRELRRKNPLFGSFPKPRSPKGKSKGTSGLRAKDTRSEKAERIDTRTPRMFSDEPAEERLLKVQKISDFKNIGPETERLFLKAGIKTPLQFKKLGWKKTMIQLCKSDPKNNHSMLAYAVIGALENKFWAGISDEAKKEARKFMKSLRDKDKLPTTKPNPRPISEKSRSKSIKKARSKAITAE